jgi:hypothetical protein
MRSPAVAHVCKALACLAVAAESVRADNAIYNAVAPSTVWFFERGSATGVLVDVEKRLVLTAEHVVRDANRAGRDTVNVIFAQIDKGNNVVVEKSSYGFEKKRKLAIQGRIVLSNRLKDLSLVQLEHLPPGVQAVPLAKRLPRPGDRIHVIGNSTYFRGGLFSYCAGSVRNSYQFDRFDEGNVFYSLAHDAATNRGDSGGPVLNDKAQLVGIISQGTTGSGEGEQVIDQSVHLLTIRRFLEEASLPVVKSLTLTATTNLPKFHDRLYLPVRRNNPVNLVLKGNGQSDLDLFVEDFDADKKNRTRVAQTGLTDQERGAFNPTWTGMTQIKVLNLFLPNDPNSDRSQTPRNTYTLEVSCPTPVRGPILLARPILAQSTNSLKIYFEAGSAKARVAVRGDGDTELLLSVSGPDNAETWKADGVHDRKQLSFPVEVAGYYTVRIENPDPRQYNAYILTID